MRTLLGGGVIVTVDDQMTVHDGGDVLIEDDRIGFVGAHYDGPYDTRIDAAGKLLMPGLINAHTHSGMSILRSLSDDVDLMVFLQERVWPRESRLTAEDVYAGSTLSAVEMLKSGVTTYVDMYFYEDELRRAAIDTGIRALITPTILAVPEWEPLLGTWEQQLDRAVQFCLEHEGDDGRIHTGLGPHAPYTISLEALRDIAAEARRIDRLVNVHLVETAGERKQFNSRGLGSTVSALNNVGFFDGRVIAAHSVWLDPGDLDIYRSKDVGVAHCPQSNAKLGAGIAPLTAMLAAAVQVGLGTDGAATNNNLDVWEEMRLAPLLAKAVALDPKPIPVAQALRLGTSMGAKAVHLPEIGSLQPGKRADIVMLRLDDTTVVPVFDSSTYISHLVYSIGRELVQSVWVNGNRVVKDGEVLTVDEERARHDAQRAAISLAERSEATGAL